MPVGGAGVRMVCRWVGKRVLSGLKGGCLHVHVSMDVTVRP